MGARVHRLTACETILLVLLAMESACIATVPAYADDSAAPPPLASDATQPAVQAVAPAPAVNGLQEFFDSWAGWVSNAKASQPSWASPIATTSGLLGQRYR